LGDEARIAILAASVVMACVGFAWLRVVPPEIALWQRRNLRAVSFSIPGDGVLASSGRC
jgi:hypothetical protein